MYLQVATIKVPISRIYVGSKMVNKIFHILYIYVYYIRI